MRRWQSSSLMMLLLLTGGCREEPLIRQDQVTYEVQLEDTAAILPEETPRARSQQAYHLTRADTTGATRIEDVTGSTAVIANFRLLREEPGLLGTRLVEVRYVPLVNGSIETRIGLPLVTAIEVQPDGRCAVRTGEAIYQGRLPELRLVLEGDTPFGRYRLDGRDLRLLEVHATGSD